MRVLVVMLFGLCMPCASVMIRTPSAFELYNRLNELDGKKEYHAIIREKLLDYAQETNFIKKIAGKKMDSFDIEVMIISTMRTYIKQHNKNCKPMEHLTDRNAHLLTLTLFIKLFNNTPAVSDVRIWFKKNMPEITYTKT